MRSGFVVGALMAIKEYPGVKHWIAAREIADVVIEEKKQSIDARFCDRVWILWMQGFNFNQIARHLKRPANDVYDAWVSEVDKHK